MWGKGVFQQWVTCLPKPTVKPSAAWCAVPNLPLSQALRTPGLTPAFGDSWESGQGQVIGKPGNTPWLGPQSFRGEYYLPFILVQVDLCSTADHPQELFVVLEVSCLLLG